MRTTESIKAQKSQETREAILSACLKLFAKNGFVSTSVNDIARAAHITKGAVYWHFKGKDELFQAILDRIRIRWQEMVLRPVSVESSAVLRLECLFDCYVELFTEAPERCLSLQRILLEGDAEFAPQVARIFRQTAQFIARILDDGKARGDFRRGIDSLLVAHSILGSLSGASLQSLANRRLTLQALIEEIKTATLARVRA
jgi:TetR/AcrR family acrAB operon transcriptional repressor